MEEDKKKRGGKTTRQQYMLYLEELQNNEAFRTNKFSSENPNIINETWDNLSRSLNSVGGPQKTVSIWKKVFSDWKCSVRKRARLIKVAAMQTGGGSPEKPLTDLENNLLSIIGTITIDGISKVPELGASSSKEIQVQQTHGDEILKTKEFQPELGASSSKEIQVQQTHSDEILKTKEFQLETATLSSPRTRFPARATKRHQEEGSVDTPTKVKKGSLLSSLKEHILETQSKEDSQNDLLTKINNHLIDIKKNQNVQLAAIVEMQKKQYQLSILKFKLK